MIELYIQNDYWFAVVQLVLAMLGMGATLTVSDFREVIVEPKAVTTGIAMQLILVPLIAFLFIQFAGISAGVILGVALIAAIPGGTVSNIFTHLAKGNTPLSISITALTTLACLITTPLILSVLIKEYMPEDFSMPAGHIAIEIGLCLLLPLIMGMAYLRCFPASAEAFSKWCIRGSLLVIALIVIGSMGAGRLDMDAFGINNLLFFCVFMATLALAAYWIPKLCGLNKPDTTAIEMEVVIRNVNLGLLIKASLFPAAQQQSEALGNMVLFSLLLFGGIQLIVGGVLVTLRRRSH